MNFDKFKIKSYAEFSQLEADFAKEQLDSKGKDTQIAALTEQIKLHDEEKKQLNADFEKQLDELKAEYEKNLNEIKTDMKAEAEKEAVKILSKTGVKMADLPKQEANLTGGDVLEQAKGLSAAQLSDFVTNNKPAVFEALRKKSHKNKQT